MNPNRIPYTTAPIYLEQVLTGAKISPNLDAKISIFRGSTEFIISYNRLMKSSGKRLRLFPDDKIFINTLNYRLEKVLLVGETGAQRAIAINPVQRTTY